MDTGKVIANAHRGDSKLEFEEDDEDEEEKKEDLHKQSEH